MESTVAVVIPTYNRIRHLRRTIGLLQQQTYANFRLYVYDNASTDGTWDYLTALAKDERRLVPYRHASNIGGAQNFAYGMSHVKEAFFTVLADDDCPLPSFLEIAMAHLLKWPDLGFAAGGTLEMTNEGRFLFAPLAFWPREGRYEAGDNIVDLLNGRHPSWNTIVFRREMLDAIGSMNPEFRLTFDLDFTLKAALIAPYVIDARPCGIFVRHAQSSSEFADERVLNEYRGMIESLSTFDLISASARQYIVGSLEKAMIERSRRIIVKSLMQGQWEQAKRVAAHAHDLGLLSSLQERMLNVPVLARPLLGRMLRVAAWLYQARIASTSLGLLHRKGIDMDVTAYAALVTNLPS